MLSVRPSVCPSVHHGSAGREAGRTAVSDDHARPRTTTHDGPRTTTHDCRARPRTAAAHDHAQPRTAVAHDHAQPHTTTHDHPRPPRTTTHNHAQPRTTAVHDDSPSRTTTHDQARPRTTAHDRPQLPYLFEEAVPTPPQGGGWSFRGLNCLARLALARERTPSNINYSICYD